MRITNLATHDRILHDLQRQALEFDKASRQVTTGERNANISDDPVAGAAVLRVDTSLRALKGYSRSITSVRARLDTEEAALDQVGDLLSRAKELGVGQSGSNANATSRAQTAIEIDGLLKQALSLGNTRIGGEFVFGGFQTDTPPFDAAGNFVGTADQRQSEVGDGVIMDTVHSGQQLFVDSGVIANLTELRDAMIANDPSRIQAALAPLDGSIDATQTNLAEIGTRYRSLDNAQAAIASFEESLTNERAENADIPLEEAMVRFTAIQTAIQAALLATSKQMQLSLTDYLPL